MFACRTGCRQRDATLFSAYVVAGGAVPKAPVFLHIQTYPYTYLLIYTHAHTCLHIFESRESPDNYSLHQVQGGIVNRLRRRRQHSMAVELYV